MAEALAHIPEGHLSESVFNTHCVSWSLGPLTIKACIDISVPSASVTVILAGTTIGHCVLSPDHTQCTVGGGVDGFKVEITFRLADNCLVADIVLRTPFKTWKKTVKLYCW